MREFKNVGVCVYVLGKRICVFVVVFVFALVFIVSCWGDDGSLSPVGVVFSFKFKRKRIAKQTKQ